MWDYYYLLYPNNHTPVLSPPVLGPPWSRTRRRGGQGLESLCSPILSSFPLLPVPPSSLSCLLSLSLCSSFFISHSPSLSTCTFSSLFLPFPLIHSLGPSSNWLREEFYLGDCTDQDVGGCRGLRRKDRSPGDRERFYMILCWQMNIILYLFKPRKCTRTLGLGTYVSIQDYWFWNMCHSDGGL